MKQHSNLDHPSIHQIILVRRRSLPNQVLLEKTSQSMGQFQIMMLILTLTIFDEGLMSWFEAQASTVRLKQLAQYAVRKALDPRTSEAKRVQAGESEHPGQPGRPHDEEF